MIDDDILLLTYLEDEPEIEHFGSIQELEAAIEQYELEPSGYGTDWLVALPLVMKPRLPAALRPATTTTRQRTKQ